MDFNWEIISTKKDRDGDLISGYLKINGVNYIKYLLQTHRGVIYNHQWDSRMLPFSCGAFYDDICNAMHSLQDLIKKYDKRSFQFCLKQSEEGHMYASLDRRVKKVSIPPKAEFKSDSMRFYFRIDPEDHLWEFNINPKKDTHWKFNIFITIDGNIFLRK
jgi:hypothetical protein